MATTLRCRFDLARHRTLALLSLGVASASSCNGPSEASAQVVARPPIRPSRSPGSHWDPVPPDERPHTRGCQSGMVCTIPVARPTTGSAAPAPFAQCDTGLSPAAVGMTAEHHAMTFSVEATRAERRSTPGACCYGWRETHCRGRALRSADGRSIVADTLPRAGWLMSPSERSPAVDARHEAIGAYWTEQAAAEHASVATFAREALDLMALGAPSELVRDAHLAALDEVEHARIAYAEASRWIGRDLGPASLQGVSCGRTAPDLAALVDRTLRDGCLGESSAALEAEHSAGCIDDPATRSAVERIARDEAEHSALAWRTVEWALGVGGPSVRDRVAIFADTLRSDLASDWDHRDVVEGELARYGVVSPDVSAAVLRATAREVVLPVVERLLAGGH